MRAHRQAGEPSVDICKKGDLLTGRAVWRCSKRNAGCRPPERTGDAAVASEAGVDRRAIDDLCPRLVEMASAMPSLCRTCHYRRRTRTPTQLEAISKMVK
jgi:hypothetical protein